MQDDLSLLINDLSADDAAVRTAAAEQLLHRSDRQAAAIALVRATGDAHEPVRELAAAALEEMGAPAREEIGPLAELLAADSADAAYWAATLLGRCGRSAATASDALATSLNDSKHLAVQERAAWALGKLGPPSPAAQGALEKAAASGKPRLARLAAGALDSR